MILQPSRAECLHVCTFCIGALYQVTHLQSASVWRIPWWQSSSKGQGSGCLPTQIQAYVPAGPPVQLGRGHACRVASIAAAVHSTGSVRADKPEIGRQLHGQLPQPTPTMMQAGMYMSVRTWRPNLLDPLGASASLLLPLDALYCVLSSGSSSSLSHPSAALLSLSRTLGAARPLPSRRRSANLGAVCMSELGQRHRVGWSLLGPTSQSTVKAPL